MKLGISRTGLALLVLASVVGVAVFVFLMGRFGGPTVRFSAAYRATAVVPDAQGLASRSDVLVRGVKVGQVSRIQTLRGPRDGAERARVTLAIEKKYAPLHRGATVRIGQKTLLGEAYVDLDRGSPGAPRLADGTMLAVSQTKPTVEVDEALKTFGAPTRRRLRSLLATSGRGARSPATAERLSATLAELDGLTGQLRTLGGELRGQATNFSGGVVDTRRTLAALDQREGSIRSIVSAGDQTLTAVAAQNRSLGAGLAELPRTLVSARRTLHDARPLVAEARPLVDDLSTAAPELTPALRDLGPAASDADLLLARLPALRRSAIPFFSRVLPVIRLARPVARRLRPALANVAPLVTYLSAHRRELTAWFSNTAGIGDHGDAKGDWARFFIFLEAGTATGTPGTLPGNAYTSPGDHAHNQAWVKGSYPRLQPLNTR